MSVRDGLTNWDECESVRDIVIELTCFVLVAATDAGALSYSGVLASPISVPQTVA